MAYETEWIDSTARFAELAPEWGAILPADSRPFDLHCWYAAWMEAFVNGNELAICTVRDGDGLAGVLPLQRRRGRDLEALANSHSGMFRPLASGPEAMDALLDAALPGAATLTVPELRAGDPGTEALAEGARQVAMLPLLEAGSTSSIVDTSGDLEVWFKQGSASWKKKLRRSRRKMGKDYDATFDVARPPVDLEAELAEGFAVEASGWKGQAGTAIVSRPDTESFYRAIATAFHTRGELRLSRIVLDGGIAAFSFCLEHRGSLYGLKAGYDERFGRLSPGLVLQLAVAEWCFEGDVSAFELGEQTEWKPGWRPRRARRRPCAPTAVARRGSPGTPTERRCGRGCEAPIVASHGRIDTLPSRRAADG